VGINLKEIYDTRVLVRNNTLKNSNHKSQSIGINFINTMSTPNYCDKGTLLNRQYIDKNTILRYETGINTEQCNCLTVDSNDIHMRNSFSYFTQYHGIWSKFSTNGEIGLNTVTGTQLTNRCIGIRLIGNNTEEIFCNIVDTTGFAFWLEGASTNNLRIQKNLMNHYFNGFYFTGNLHLNNQVLDASNNSVPHKNHWVGKATNMSNFEFNSQFPLNMSATKFYFWNADLNPNTKWSSTDIQSPPGGGAPPTLDNSLPYNNQFDCGVGVIGGGRLVVRVLQDSTNLHWDTTSVFGWQSKWLKDRGTAKSLVTYADTIIGLILPLCVQADIDSIATTTCSPSVLVDKYLSENDFSSAYILNNSITSSCTMGSVYKEFNSLVIPYLQTYRNFDTVIIDSNDVLSIIDIANLCIYQYGDVVGSARSFVRNFINDTMIFSNECETIEDIETREVPQGKEESNNIDSFIVYPVPATNQLNILSLVTENLLYQIYDLLGRLILNGTFYERTTVNVESLAPGNYVIRLYNENHDSNKKFVITR